MCKQSRHFFLVKPLAYTELLDHKGGGENAYVTQTAYTKYLAAICTRTMRNDPKFYWTFKTKYKPCGVFFSKRTCSQRECPRGHWTRAMGRGRLGRRQDFVLKNNNNSRCRVIMSRKKVTCPNLHILKLVEEWREDARSKGAKVQHAYSKVNRRYCTSLSNTFRHSPDIKTKSTCSVLISKWEGCRRLFLCDT